jgi:2,4-dienoyl-CoA reductase-like NADH-dependent reductase (Old Yellow Enzyme family)
VRISATDWREDGSTLEDSVALSRAIKPLGVDLIDCSSGGVVSGVKIPAASGYQVAFAEKVRREAQIRTGAVGLITSAAQAEDVVRSGQADMVLLAREMLRDPYWPLHAARKLGVDVKWPDQYLRARD